MLVRAGKKDGLLFFEDVERNRIVCVEAVNETDEQKVRKHVQKVMRAGPAVKLRTDELSVYVGIVPQEQHKICLAHWRKSKCRRAGQLYRECKTDGMQFEASDMLKLLELLKAVPRPPTLPEAVEKLVSRYINCRKGTLWKVNLLLQHIERTWERLAGDGGDRTNNATKRIIGLDYNIRGKTARGFKAWNKILCHCYLSKYLRGNDGVCDLRKVV